MSLTGGSFPSDIISLIMIGLLVGALGVGVLVSAIRGRRS
jgi:hypothetical protein